MGCLFITKLQGKRCLYLVPSEVRALPLAAGINVGGQAFFSLSFFSLLSSSGSLLILPEGVVVGIQIFAWAPN